MNNVVLISGKQGSGKTTLAKELATELEHRGYMPIMLSFAGVIYEMHDAVLKILSQYGIKRDLVKDGPLLQLLGTEWGRQTIDQDIWVKTLQGKIDRVKEDNPDKNLVFLVPDCRFRNEFEGFPFAQTIRLECSSHVRKIRCEMWRDRDDHVSETDLDEYASAGLFKYYFNTELDSTLDCVQSFLGRSGL